jgi:hypothetical protein
MQAIGVVPSNHYLAVKETEMSASGGKETIPKGWFFVIISKID